MVWVGVDVGSAAGKRAGGQRSAHRKMLREPAASSLGAGSAR